MVVLDAMSLPDTQAVGWDVPAPNGTLVRILPPRIDRVAYPGMKVVDDIYDNVHASQLRPLGIALYAQLPQLIAVGDI